MTTSPKPVKKIESAKELNFIEAMTEIIFMRKVTKLEWNDPKITCYLDGTFKITLLKNGYKPCDWIISDGDVAGSGWVIVV